MTRAILNFARVMYRTRENFYACVGACACDRTHFTELPESELSNSNITSQALSRYLYDKN